MLFGFPRYIISNETYEENKSNCNNLNTFNTFILDSLQTPFRSKVKSGKGNVIWTDPTSDLVPSDKIYGGKVLI